MTTTTDAETESRPLPPPLVPVLPDCSICEREVSTDEDMFHCEHCDAWWPMRDAFDSKGQWDDYLDRGQCESTDGTDGPRCVLTDQHVCEHRDGDGREWPGMPYKIWGYRSPNGFTSAAQNEAHARRLASILGAGYDVVWRMSSSRPYSSAWHPAGCGELT